MRPGLTVALFMWMNMFAALAGEGEAFPPPQTNQPCEHMQPPAYACPLRCYRTAFPLQGGGAGLLPAVFGPQGAHAR
jgi:hypothetical protein